MIFSEVLLNTVNEINIARIDKGMPKVEVDCLMILNDNDPEAAQKLPEAVAPFVAASEETNFSVLLKVVYYQDRFEALVDRLCARIKDGGYRNVIYNLDQCGDSRVNRETIARLMQSENSVEVIFTFAVQSLIAFLSRRNPERVRKRLEYLNLRPEELTFTTQLMSKDEWLGTAERIVFDHFRKTAPYFTPFSINNPNGWRYWLMHFAKNYRARQVYNDVLHDNSSEQAHFGRAGLNMLSYDPSHHTSIRYLFDVDGRNAARQQLPDDISRLVSDGGNTIGISEFYRNIYNETPAHSDDIHAAIFDNPDLEVVTLKKNKRRFPHTISLDDTLRLKKQKSFHLILPNKTQIK